MSALRVPALTRTFVEKVAIDSMTGCWVWNGHRDKWGYGRVKLRGQQPTTAHRATWMHFYGMVPAGLELDHLCRNTSCCNPDHLEPVTHAENLRRAAAARTACPSGHPWSADNTRVYSDGVRRCRECNRLRAAANRARSAA